MARESFRLPDVGEGLTEAEIVAWRVAVGDVITVNQVIVEIETAKAIVELPAPFAGTVVELLATPGQVVEVGKPIITVDTGGSDGGGSSTGSTDASAPPSSVAAAAPGVLGEGAKPEPVLVGYGVTHGSTSRRARTRPAGPSSDEAGTVATPTPPVAAPTPTNPPAAAAAPVVHDGLVRSKPPVRKLAKDHGIDLRTVTPTGPDGTVTREDVERALSGGGSAAPAAGAGSEVRTAPSAAPSAATATPGEVIPVRGVLRSMADAMVRSAYTAPHVTEWVEVDVTRTMESVERLKSVTDVRVSPMLFAAAGLIRAAARFPRINSSWVDTEEGAEIRVHGAIHLGVAVASPRGLLVPVVSNAESLSLVGLAEGINAMVQRARDGITTPQELMGGTISLTNVGVFGIDAGTPILVPGQVAILAIGQVARKPWVVRDPDGQESLAIRDVMTISLSFDHRVIDGELGSRALRSIADYLHDPVTATLVSDTPLASLDRR